jgi:hypothetical protein
VKITSRWNGGPVFVRVFGPSDTIYMFGRWETTLKFGETAEFNLPEGKLQLEIKQGGLFGPFIVRPGQIWSNSEVRLLNDKGELVTPDAGDVVNEVNADLVIAMKYLLFGVEKSEVERVQRTITFSGPAQQRRVNLADIEIVRDARTKIEAIHGAFDPANGEMSLSANVVVSFGPFVGNQRVGLTTGAASSGSRFTDSGSRYDRASGAAKLVGGGAITMPISTEFFVTVDVVFAGPVG